LVIFPCGRGRPRSQSKNYKILEVVDVSVSLPTPEIEFPHYQ